uniref:Uncharacterized protein n=1 Tax=viral metagenome TaxID=1070528 RepID=A0A6M3KDR9_9ZZZZ
MNVKINKHLKEALKVAEAFESQGRHKLALEVIVTASRYALYMKSIHRIKDQPVICKCKRKLTNGKEVEFYNKVGECMSCDHNKYEV